MPKPKPRRPRHVEFATSCGYLPPEVGRKLSAEYDEVIALIVSMINHPEKWIISDRNDNC